MKKSDGYKNKLKETVDLIIRDIQDRNIDAQVPKKKIVPTRENVLIKKDNKCPRCGKNIQKAEGNKFLMDSYDTKKAFAQAKMGVRQVDNQNKVNRGTTKLKNFLMKIECKRYHK